MTAQNAELIPYNDWYEISIYLVTQSVDSPHSKRAYSRALIQFLDWYEGRGRPGFTKATPMLNPGNSCWGGAAVVSTRRCRPFASWLRKRLTTGWFPLPWPMVWSG